MDVFVLQKIAEHCFVDMKTRTIRSIKSSTAKSVTCRIHGLITNLSRNNGIDGGCTSWDACRL